MLRNHKDKDTMNLPQGGFNKWGVPRNHMKSSILMGFSLVNHPAMGVPRFMETSWNLQMKLQVAGAQGSPSRPWLPVKRSHESRRGRRGVREVGSDSKQPVPQPGGGPVWAQPVPTWRKMIENAQSQSHKRSREMWKPSSHELKGIQSHKSLEAWTCKLPMFCLTHGGATAWIGPHYVFLSGPWKAALSRLSIYSVETGLARNMWWIYV